MLMLKCSLIVSATESLGLFRKTVVEPDLLLLLLLLVLVIDFSFAANVSGATVFVDDL